MRHPGFRLTWSATVVLLVVNVAAFILQNVFYRFSTFPLDSWFALSVGGLRHGFVWQLLTYQFMHGGWLHLLLNCWAIYVFGREVETTLGRGSFLTLYFSSTRRPGVVLRVSSTRVCNPESSFTYLRVVVATPLMRCITLSIKRSI